MSKQPVTEHEDLNQFIPRPDNTGGKRHMISCEPDAYAYISQLAEELSTSRNRIVTALVAFYREVE